MNTHKKNKKGGFTLIEILIVIGIIAVLAAIVLIAVNPSRQFAKANDAQRSANLNAILNGIGQYIVDQKGATSTLALTVAPKDIRSGSEGIDLCTLLVKDGGYIAALPVDPKTGTGGPNVTSAGCASYDTQYTAQVDASGKLITVSAPDAEATSIISVSR